MVRMDRLLEAWRADPRVDATVELCAMLIRAALKAAPQKLLPDEFVIGFAGEARTRHEKNVDVAIAVADLYLATGLVQHAGALLEVVNQFAGNDSRVKERLDKIGRRRRTAEFSVRTADPETLDAPTTPLDPPTEPAGRGPPPPLSAPLNPRRKPTAIGLPLAPPPLPPPDRRTKVGVETQRGSLSAADDLRDKPIRDDETTHTESVPPELPPPPKPRQRLKTVIGTGDDLALHPIPKEPPRQPSRQEPPPDDDDGPATRVDNVADEGPSTKADPKDAAPETRGYAEPSAHPRRNPTLDFGARGPAPLPKLGVKSVASDHAPTQRGTAVTNNLAAGEKRASSLGPKSTLAPPPAKLAPKPADDVADSGWDDPPTRVGGDVSEAQVETPTRSAEVPPAAGKPPAQAQPSVAEMLEARMAARRSAARKPRPVLGPALEDGPALEGPTRVVGGPDPLAASTSVNTSVNTSINTSIKRPDIDTEGDPTHARPVLAKPIPTGSMPRPPASMLQAPPPGFSSKPAPLGTSTPDDDDDDDDSNVTGIQDLPPAIPFRPNAPPVIGGLPRIPPVSPSDPETETATAVRPPTLAPPPNAAALRVPPPPPLSAPAPTTLSGAITNLWEEPPPRPQAQRSAPPIADPLTVEPDDDDDDSMVTGLREPHMMPPLRPTQASATAAPRISEPAAPLVAPVIKGGTLAMAHGSPRSSFPSEPPPDDDEVPRTHVLNASEALAAARADPRPSFARSRSMQPPAGSQPPAMGTPFPSAVQRGQQLGQPAAPAWGADAFSGPPVVGPAPSAPPVFGPPPPSVPRFGLDEGIGGFLPPLAPPAPTPPPPTELAPRALPQDVPDPLAMAPLPGDPGWDAPPIVPVPPMPPVPNAPSLAPRPELVSFSDAPSESRGRPYKLYAALVVAIVAVASLVGYATYLLLSNRRAEQAAQQSEVPAEVEQALLRATPSDLGKVDGELRKLEATSSPASRKARLRHRVLVGFEVSGAADGIADAKAAALASGLSEAEVAYADVAIAALSSQPAVDSLLSTEGRGEDAFFQLALGIYRERRGEAGAREAFEAARKAEPKLVPASVRLSRFLLLEGQLDDAAKIVAELPEGGNERAALEAWLAAARKMNAAAPGPALPDLTLTSADLPRTLHPVFSALSTQRAGDERPKKGSESDPQLRQAITDAETPAIALFFGEIAFRRRDEGSVAAAAERALTLHKEDARAIGLIARSALRAGSYEKLEKLLAGVSGPAARPLRATLAYERGDVDALAKIAREVQPGEDADGVIKTRLALLRGDSVISAATLEALKKSDTVAGELCAVDGLLLLGETAKAKAIVAGWSDASTNPGRALRRARVLRAEGNNEEASKALEASAESAPALLERILVEAEISTARAHALSLVDDRLGKLRPYVEAYVLARMDEGGKASKKLDGVVVPGFDAPLALRIVAALAFGEIDDTERGEPLVRVLHEKFPAQIDVKRAARRIGVTK